MDGSTRYNRRRSGYEPSDTENEWHESPKRDAGNGYDQSRRLQIAMLEMNNNAASPARRRHSKSPYNPHRQTGNFNGNVSPLSRRTYSDLRRNVSPLALSERRMNPDLFSQSERRIVNPDAESSTTAAPFSASERRRYASPAATAAEAKSGYGKRAATAPRSRMRERGQQTSCDQSEKQQKQDKDTDGISHKHRPSVGEINEMVANAKLSRMSNGNYDIDSIDSVSPGDIFFSRDYYAVQNVAEPAAALPKPPGFVGKNHNMQGMSQATTNSASVVSRQSSTVSESSGRTSASTRRFVANRRKSQSETWFSCIKNGYCRTSNRSPEKQRPFDEASFIGKAVVVESLRPLWADKHQPVSLTGFACHKNEAQLLQKLANSEIFPHILLKGPLGTGKKALTMALLREIYGDPVWNISHDLRYFHILESRPKQVVVPVSSSPHHVELNVYLESKAAYALTALVKQISSEHRVTPEVSVAPTKTDYKVLVLYDVDKAAENIQHLIKWIMDCYSDSCRLILCCEDDVDILDSVKSRCKVVAVEASSNHEVTMILYGIWIIQGSVRARGISIEVIRADFVTLMKVMEVLIQIAKKEGFELPISFAAKIANKSKQNLRRAIMALEACKLHNYPFAEDQPIPLGWEEAVMELAANILAHPYPNRLLVFRGKIQKLLGDFVHPKLILLKVVEQFLRGVDAGLKREIYYWYAYYDKRLPSGTNALLKLEEFVAKLMSIYRKSSSSRHP